MSEHEVKPDMVTHESAQALLPWLVAQTLQGKEFAMVKAHVQECAQCQEDLAWQYKLRDMEPGNHNDNAPDMERALAQLLPRLTTQQKPWHAQLQLGWLEQVFNKVGWMKLALVSQCAVIAVLAVLLMHPADNNASYHLLGAGKPVQANMVVVFKPETREQDLRRIVLSYGAHIVDGPTVTDAYLLEVSPTSLQPALNGLHTEPMVTMAASLQGDKP